MLNSLSIWWRKLVWRRIWGRELAIATPLSWWTTSRCRSANRIKTLQTLMSTWVTFRHMRRWQSSRVRERRREWENWSLLWIERWKGQWVATVVSFKRSRRERRKRWVWRRDWSVRGRLWGTSRTTSNIIISELSLLLIFNKCRSRKRARPS